MQFIEGVAIDNLVTHSEDAEIEKQNLIKLNIKSDTINDQFIFAGKFKASKEDLQSVPIITNDEIISFNIKTSEIEISKSGFEKLIKLDRTNSENGIGIQFAICINETPKIFGYFYNYSYIVTYIPTTYSISYKTKEREKNYKSMLLKFNNFKAEPNGKINMRMLDSIQEKELFTVLKNSNRIK